ncbi:hypothetical protein BDK92_1800 [Micromonospora pisi]|uniref:Uncharacterized protein n=1 Tax=Micromonospora pisi TaxID=589240 RepID=A0A495JFK8_9ACTN|nr:hypothetical protein BDK92_1800 [Micromonospora pisi]
MIHRQVGRQRRLGRAHGDAVRLEWWLAEPYSWRRQRQATLRIDLG